MALVIIDTEYTTWPGALESGWSGPGQHREIVQIGAIRLDEGFREVASLDILVRPSVNPELSPLFTDLTGVTQARVDATGIAFGEALGIALDFSLGGTLPVVCMNSDEAVFRENCALNHLDFPFPAPWHRLVPVLRAQGIDVARTASGDLHRLTRSPLEGWTHNALHDVRSIACWLLEAMADGRVASLGDLPAGPPHRDHRSSVPLPLP